jgi:hypothetical protein
MNISETKSGAKAIYLQAACLAGFEVGPFSPERLVDLVNEAYTKVDESRRPEAIANLLRVIASTLEEAQNSGETRLHEHSVDAGKKKVCPVYPFN